MLTTYLKNGTLGIVYPIGNGKDKAVTIYSKANEAKKMYLINKDLAKALGYEPPKGLSK